MPQDPEHYVTPAQLCIGLYIRLEGDWMSHPFAFNQFKIRTAEQIDSLRALGLERIRYDPKRSDVQPAPVSGEVSASAPPAMSEADRAAIEAKRVRVEELARQRAAINECEKRFLAASRNYRNLSRNLFARPEESVLDARALVDEMVASVLTQRDMAIHLMNDKLAGEEVYHHPLNVAVLALMLGKELKLGEEELKLLGLGALFHDVGKAKVPESLLLKTDPLTPSERDLFEQHTVYGVEIGKKLRLPPEVLAMILQHHEYQDGSGYPRATSGDGILPLCRLLVIVNAYDNLCNRPNPKDSLTPYEALAQMFSQGRARFDAQPLSVFIRSMGVYPPGTLVQLSNNALAMVMQVNASQPLKPCVLVYDPSVARHEAVILDLEEEPDLSIVRSIRPAQLPQPVFDYLNPRKRMTYFLHASQQGVSHS